MTYFTSDWHLGDHRIINPNLFYRPFNDMKEQHDSIINGILASGFQDGDEMIVVGDVMFENTEDAEETLKTITKELFPNSIFRLVSGNYDLGKFKDGSDRQDLLSVYFDTIQTSMIFECPEQKWYLNHYPTQTRAFLQRNPNYFGITGHIHGLWKVQKDMINVSVDAWHFRPVSLTEMLFCLNGIRNHYDQDVFLC